MKRTHLGFVALLIFAASIAAPVSAQKIELPANDGYVTDSARLLTPEQDQALEDLLSAYERETSNQIVVLIIPSLRGESGLDIALEAHRTWGVGGSEKDNGIVLLVAYEDREVFISVGNGLEGAVPDIVAKGVIDEEIVPRFREGAYAEGIRGAIEALQKHIGGEYTADRYAERNGAGWSPAMFFVFLVLLQWIVAILERTKSWWLGGVLGGIGALILVAIFSWWWTIPILVAAGLLLDFLVSRNFKKRGPTKWWAGGNWGPGGRGGFGGFGGGGFHGGGGTASGGGAGGRW